MNAATLSTTHLTAAFETPLIEYRSLLPMLIVFGVAVVGVLVEAFMGRTGRHSVQLVLADKVQIQQILLNLMRKCAQMQRQSVEHLAFREVRGEVSNKRTLGRVCAELLQMREIVLHLTPPDGPYVAALPKRPHLVIYSLGVFDFLCQIKMTRRREP